MGKLTQVQTRQIISDTIAAILTCGTKKRAAEVLNINEATLYDRLNNYPEINEAITRAKEIAAEKLVTATPRAADIVIGNMETKRYGNENAWRILDGVGVTNKKQESVGVQVGDVKIIVTRGTE